MPYLVRLGERAHMDIVSVIFEVISSAITNFVGCLNDALGAMTELFYVAPSGTETTGHMTFLGVLLLIGVGVAIVYFCFRLIKGLVRRA